MRGLLNRTKSYEPLSRAGAVVVNIGVNDLAAEGQYWSGNIPLLIDKMLAHFAGGPVVLCLVAPISSSFQSGYLTQTNIDTINGWLVSKAATYPNVVLVDTPAAMKSGGYLNPAYTTDGLHWNGAGQNVWIGLVRNAISKVVGS